MLHELLGARDRVFGEISVLLQVLFHGVAFVEQLLSVDPCFLCGEKHAPAGEIIKRGRTALARTRKTTLRVCNLEDHHAGPLFLPDCQLGVGEVRLLSLEGDSDVRAFHGPFH